MVWSLFSFRRMDVLDTLQFSADGRSGHPFSTDNGLDTLQFSATLQIPHKHPKKQASGNQNSWNSASDISETEPGIYRATWV